MTPDQRRILDALWPTMLHLPYLWGGHSPLTGLDCSGLVVELLQSVGVMPRRGLDSDANAQTLFRKFPPVPAERVEFGDLVFFGATANSITHVGFCVSHLLMLEAGGGNQATTTRERAIREDARIRLSAFVGPGARRDLVGFCRPGY
jgi:cell wall-associated NlpC family hydrolase